MLNVKPKGQEMSTFTIDSIELEDEYHFLNICPAYQEKRCSLLDYLEKEYRIKIRRMSPNRIFMFPINPPSGNVRIQKLIEKHTCIFECFEKRKAGLEIISGESPDTMTGQIHFSSVTYRFWPVKLYKITQNRGP